MVLAKSFYDHRGLDVWLKVGASWIGRAAGSSGFITWVSSESLP